LDFKRFQCRKIRAQELQRLGGAVRSQWLALSAVDTACNDASFILFNYRRLMSISRSFHPHEPYCTCHGHACREKENEMNDPKSPMTTPTTPTKPTSNQPTPASGADQPNPHTQPAEGPRIPQESTYSPPRANKGDAPRGGAATDDDD
jgi:hypothetical protein